MTHDLKYILKRIAIGVGIILVLSLIRNFIILDVHAKEIKDDYTSLVYRIPNDSTLHECDNLVTNYELSSQGLGACGEQYIPQLQLHYYSNMLPTLNGEYPYYYEDSENPSYSWQRQSGSGGSIVPAWYQPINYKNFYNLVGYNVSFYQLGFRANANEDYNLLIKVVKSDDVNYSYDTLDLDYLNVTIRDTQGSYYDISEYITNVRFEYVKGYNSAYKDNPTENPFYSNSSYMYVTFHIDSNVNNVTSNLKYFSNISIYVNKGETIEGINYLQNNKSIFNNSSNGTMKHKIIFTYGGDIQIQGQCDELGYCDQGLEWGGEDLDTITEKDSNLIAEYETCDTLDIPCHLRNILQGINNLIVRVGNAVRTFFTNITRALKELFIPNFNRLWQEWGELKLLLINKLGFLYDFEQIFENFLNNFNNLNEGEVVINIPEVRVPNFNFVIIQQQSWNISAPFQEEGSPLKTLYIFYKMMISAIFFFMFMNHGKNRLNSIVGATETIEEGVVPYERKY